VCTSLGGGVVSAQDRFRIFSPLLGFLAYCLYLVLLSPDPFLTKWINGSFALFLALILANVIRRSLSSRRDDDRG
jgi:uncharacterized MnhB-related membrane protein